MNTCMTSLLYEHMYDLLSYEHMYDLLSISVVVSKKGHIQGCECSVKYYYMEILF